MTSVLNVDTIADKAGTGPVELTKQSAAKAWFLASNSAVLTDSFNTSSGLDNGGGDYTFTFTSAMSSANFESTATPANWAKRYGSIAGRTTTTETLKFYDETDVLADCTSGSAIHGDLA
jgi:hypothetical protein